MENITLSTDPLLGQPTELKPWLNSFNRNAGTWALGVTGVLVLLTLVGGVLLYSTGDGPAQWHQLVEHLRAESFSYLQGHSADVLLALGGTLLVVSLLTASYLYARNEWLTDCDADQLSLDEAEMAMSEELTSYVASLPVLTAPPLKKALGTTWKVLRQACAYHRRTLLQQTAYQYALARTLLYSSLGAAFMGLFLVGEGWKASPLPVQVLFLTFSVAIACCSTMPRLLCYEQNIAAQLQRYRLYRQLQVECFHFAAASRRLDAKGDAESLSSLLCRIHQQIRDNPFTAYDFESIDPSQATNMGKSILQPHTT